MLDNIGASDSYEFLSYIDVACVNWCGMCILLINWDILVLKTNHNVWFTVIGKYDRTMLIIIKIKEIIIYQCYVYRTNIRHIPSEVAWECDTTSVIRWVWYDANYGEKMLIFGLWNLFFWIFFLNFCLNFFFELFFDFFLNFFNIFF